MRLRSSPCLPSVDACLCCAQMPSSRRSTATSHTAAPSTAAAARALRRCGGIGNQTFLTLPIYRPPAHTTDCLRCTMPLLRESMPARRLLHASPDMTIAYSRAVMLWAYCGDNVAALR